MNIPTSDMRRLWADYFKQGYTDRVRLLGRDGVKVHEFTLDAWRALEAALVECGYPDALIVSTYYPRLIGGGQSNKGPTEAPWSLHSFSGVALDIDPGKNPFIRGRVFSWTDTVFTLDQVDAVCGIRTMSGAQVWRWGGNTFGPYDHDYMHWQLTCTPADIESGIDWTTVKGSEVETVWLSLKFWQRMQALGGLTPQDKPAYYTREGINGDGTNRANPDEVSNALAFCFERLSEGGDASLEGRLADVEIGVDQLGDRLGGVIETLRSV